MEENEVRADNAVRVICLSDLYIGRPVSVLRQGTGERRREEVKDALRALLTRVDETRAQIVIFGGNLVDKAYLTNETLVFLAQAFREREWCNFIITPGPEDYFEKTGFWKSKRWPKNVHVFADEVLGSVHFYDLRVTVYGWGYRGKACTVSPFLGNHATPKGHLSILCGRTDLAGEGSENTPITEEDLAAFGADYIALSGKPHDGFKIVANSIYAYCGAFQSDAFGADGGDGYVELTAVPRGNSWSLSYERRDAGTYRYAECALDVSHVRGFAQITERIRSLFRKKGYDDRTAVHLRLTGVVSPDTVFDGWETVELGVYALRVSDETLPLDGAERLLHEMTAVGELYRHFYTAMTGGTDAEKKEAARAFRVGYAALLNKDFARF